MLQNNMLPYPVFFEAPDITGELHKCLQTFVDCKNNQLLLLPVENRRRIQKRHIRIILAVVER
ncbi:hypothetical protein D3C81_2212990 [compost metagenome]